MIKYIHGSEDSLDTDVIYVFSEMPSFQECQKFCSDIDENRNIITVKNGEVEKCFKGTNEEINNALIDTYSLHEQSYPLIITSRVERDILIKDIRVLRCLLSHCSRSDYRKLVKSALKSHDFYTRIQALKSINFSSINDYGKGRCKEDVLKVFAFQLGQSLGLHKGIELYTKSSVAKEFPDLKDYLYRKPNMDVTILNEYIQKFIDIISKYEVTISNDKCSASYFVDFDKLIDLKTENYILRK